MEIERTAPYFVSIPGEDVTSVHSHMDGALSDAARQAIRELRNPMCNLGENNVRLVEDWDGTLYRVEVEIWKAGTGAGSRRLCCDAQMAMIKCGDAGDVYKGAPEALPALIDKHDKDEANSNE